MIKNNHILLTCMSFLLYCFDSSSHKTFFFIAKGWTMSKSTNFKTDSYRKRIQSLRYLYHSISPLWQPRDETVGGMISPQNQNVVNERTECRKTAAHFWLETTASIQVFVISKLNAANGALKVYRLQGCRVWSFCVSRGFSHFIIAHSGENCSFIILSLSIEKPVCRVWLNCEIIGPTRCPKNQPRLYSATFSIQPVDVRYFMFL